MAAFCGSWRADWEKVWEEWMGPLGLPCHFLGSITFVNWDSLGCKGQNSRPQQLQEPVDKQVSQTQFYMGSPWIHRLT